MGSAVFWVAILAVLFGVCCANPSPCTNVRFTVKHSSSLLYDLAWDPPLAATSSHYRIRCLSGCDAYTSVQWDTHEASSRVPTDFLLRSHYSASKSGSVSAILRSNNNRIDFELGVTYVDEQGAESPSTNQKSVRHVTRDTPTSTAQSLTSGTTTGGGNSTSNSTSSSGQLTSGSTSSSSSTTSTIASSTTGTQTPGTIITITLTITGDSSEFNTTAFAITLALSLGVSPDSIHVVIVSGRKRATPFTVQAQVTYSGGSVPPDSTTVYSALNSSAVNSFLNENNFTISYTNPPPTSTTTISSTSSTTSTSAPTTSTPPDKEKNNKKNKIKGPIIAAIVIPVVVVLAAIVIVVVVLRVRRRRWEQRGVELESIYKSF